MHSSGQDAHDQVFLLQYAMALQALYCTAMHSASDGCLTADLDDTLSLALRPAVWPLSSS